MHVADLDDQSSPFAASSVPPFRPRSGETSFLRLARLAADLGNGINQQTPRFLSAGLA
jgi:hypothetical protein